MKTVFVSILSGIEAKSILRTNVVARILEREGTRVVLLVKTAERAEFYKKEFHHGHLVYEVIGPEGFSRFDPFMEWLKHYLVNTKSQKLYRRLAFLENKNIFAYVSSSVFSGIVSNRFFRSLSRWFDRFVVRDHNFDGLLEKYNPDAIFLANLFDPREISLLRGARIRKIKTIGFINSWDKITAKGFVRLLPDTLIVPNDIVKDEALRYVNISALRIVVSGPPQYDTYFNREGIESRESFLKKIHADSSKKLIVFAPMGLAFSNSDWQAIDYLHEVIEGHFKNDAELLVRFQPNDFFGDEGFKTRPWLRFDLPGTRFTTTRGVDWDMTTDDLIHLKNTLHHMHMLISYASSIAIDAAIFDKPVINIGFELRDDQSPLKTPTLRYTTAHYSKALDTGGIFLATTKEHLIEKIRTYLSDPATDAGGRSRLVQEQCSFTDGKAGARIAESILSCLQ